VSGIQQLLLGGAPSAAYQIERSLRFNSADSAYLNRTPASAGNRRTFTISYWIKRTALLTSPQYLFSAGSGTSDSTWFTLGTFDWTGSGPYDIAVSSTWSSGGISTNALFRDVSAWYHFVWAVDTTQASASNRIKVWVNGVLQTGTTPAISQNTDLAWNNSGVVHYIGARIDGGPRQFFNGYLTEIYNIDGQALTPSSFGETDTDTGVWKPKKYTGTYGTNGFYLNFSDNSGTTSTTLGKDSSGNGNNWTPNNFSVTAGAGNDSLVDTPTNYGTDTGAGGEVRGNYCTLNPLDQDLAVLSVTLSNGNLTASGSSYGVSVYRCTYQVPQSGKWYWESVYTAITSAVLFGIRSYATGSSDVQYLSNGLKNIGGTTSAYGSSWTTNDVIGIAVDRDAGTVTFYKNNSSQGAISIPTNSATFDIAFNTTSPYGSTTVNVNFGQRPFAYTAPSGFKALCTQNLPTPTIGATSTTQAGKFFNVVLWTGNSTASQAITGVGFQPDLVWAKSRPANSGQDWVDAVRGATKNIQSNNTGAETTSNTVISFQSDGFTVGDGLGYDINKSGESTVGWCWNAGGSNATNTSGTITSTVRASTTAGFSIVTYTGNATSNQTVGHGLGKAVDMLIIKSRTSNPSPSWIVWHRSVCSGNGKALALEEQNALQGPFVTPIWDSSNTTTQSSSTTFTIGANTSINTSGHNYVAYCFAPVEGYSAFGSYTGNGSTDGSFVYTGFRPRMIIFKRSSAGGNDWRIIDTSRSPYNQGDQALYPNSAIAEAASGNDAFDILSNGFKQRGTSEASNGSGSTYIYAAFAEFPFKFSLAR